MLQDQAVVHTYIGTVSTDNHSFLALSMKLIFPHNSTVKYKVRLKGLSWNSQSGVGGRDNEKEYNQMGKHKSRWGRLSFNPVGSG